MEGRVLRTSVKKSTRGCGPPNGAGFQCGEEQAALESLRRGRGLHCGHIKCGARQGLVINEERRDRGRVQRDGVGALKGGQAARAEVCMAGDEAGIRVTESEGLQSGEKRGQSSLGGVEAGKSAGRRGGGEERGRCLTRGVEAAAAGSWGWAGSTGGEQGWGFRWRRKGGPGSGSHLKSLSLDVIFSRRLEMWKAAVLMVAARRGPASGREYGGAGAPCPASPSGLCSPDRNSSPRPAQPAPGSSLGGRQRGRPKGSREGLRRLGPVSAPARGRSGTNLHTRRDGELTTSHLTTLPYDARGSTALPSVPLDPACLAWAWYQS